MLNFRERVLALLDDDDEQMLTKAYATWLLDEIDSPVWRMLFGESNCEIDWRVKVGRYLLTDPHHASLLKTFKSWLLIQTHPVCCERKPSQGQVAYNSVTQAIRQIDYMLLRSEAWGLAEHGLRAVTTNDVLNMLFAFESHSADQAAVYEWDRRLSEYLVEQAKHVTDEQLAQATEQLPAIAIIELAEEEWTLSLSLDQLIRARTYLWLNKFYKVEKRLGYRYSPRTTLLAEDIYRQTLWGHSKKPIHEELCIMRFESHYREYPGVDVRTSVGDAASAQSFGTRKATLLTLPMLAQFGCEVPTNAIGEAMKRWTSVPENLRPPGRFLHPSFWQVMDTFRDSTEFALTHGDHLVASYHNVLRAAIKADISVASFVLQCDVRDYLEPKTLALGAKVWALKTKIALPQGYPVPLKSGTARGDSAEYFRRLRKNEGVTDLLEILCGAIQHNVGALTARRQSELRNLPAVGALDPTRRFLMFGNAKSGYEGIREIELRPIPKLGADLIGILEALHSGMPATPEDESFLFSMPGERGTLIHHISAYNGALDSLCDYFETPLNDEGRRNYIRQHQLRKFFVIAFFYGSAYASLDVLRWFLGHSDAEYLWNYITSEIPGEMLRSIKATFIVESMRGGTSVGRDAPPLQIDSTTRCALEALTLERFGTRSFKLIDGAALEGYIDVLLKRGLQVEPIFYDGPAGKAYVMGVTIAPGAIL